MILRQNQKRSWDFFRNVMSCRIEVCEKAGKMTIRMAYEMVMPYHLHMPSYFLETFTEYPYLKIGFPKSFYQQD